MSRGEPDVIREGFAFLAYCVKSGKGGDHETAFDMLGALKPLAEKLAGSPNSGVKEQAQLLLRESNSWWSYKTDPELRDW